MKKFIIIGLTIFLSLFLFMHFSYAEKVKGTHLQCSEKYQTSLGTLPCGWLIQNGNQIKMVGNNMEIIFAFIHMGSDEATPILDNVGVFQGKTNLSPHITFVVDQNSGKWVATNGTMCIKNDETLLLNNTTVKIIGGGENPIKILGQPFSNTTVLIKKGKPFIRN